MQWRVLTLACLLGLGLAARYGRSVLVPAQEEHDAVLVLAGGVDAGGRPHEAVMRRLRRAAKLYAASRERGHTLAVVANGGGTTHKPRWVSPAGYAVPEAALMARELERDGVAAQDIYLESLSDDTIGNAFYARTMHADPSRWHRLVVVTSEFQMPRAVAIYRWVFSLAPQPAGKPPYVLSFDAVGDRGTLPPAVLQARRAKEAASLRAFVGGDLIRMTRLSELHAW